MTIKQTLEQSANCLKVHKIPFPELDAEVLLSFVLEKDKAFLHTYPEKPLTKTQGQKLQLLITRRSHGQPIAYLTGHKEFFGLDFIVSKDVLVPRPETELLVEKTLTLISDKENLRILEIGTGSGCLIASLAKKSPKNLYFASDISTKALAIAQSNAKKHKVKITFRSGGLLEPWISRNFDIIIANLPYGWKTWGNNSSTETRALKFEPAQALFAGDKGLALYKKLFQQISKMNIFPTAVLIEFDPRQIKEIKKLTKVLPVKRLSILKDLYNRNRAALIELKTF